MDDGKSGYLKRLTANIKMRSVDLGTDLAGSSPPSVFIGSWNYPKVLAGPMMAPVHGDTHIMDSPESWIPSGTRQEDIIGYRMNLVRGKRPVGISDVEHRFVGKLREIALSTTSVESEMRLSKKPRGFSFSEERPPHGPSADLVSLDVDNARWERNLERVYYDTDLPASERACETSNAGSSQTTKTASGGLSASSPCTTNSPAALGSLNSMRSMVTSGRSSPICLRNPSSRSLVTGKSTPYPTTVTRPLPGTWLARMEAAISPLPKLSEDTTLA